MEKLIPIAQERPERPTTRERQILDLIWAGLTNQEIAFRLSIAAKTVESHRANLMRKFRAANTAQLLRMALLQGELHMPPTAERDTAAERGTSVR